MLEFLNRDLHSTSSKLNIRSNWAGLYHDMGSKALNMAGKSIIVIRKFCAMEVWVGMLYYIYR